MSVSITLKKFVEEEKGHGNPSRREELNLQNVGEHKRRKSKDDAGDNSSKMIFWSKQKRENTCQVQT
jgi:hypothetical protein